MNWYFSIFFLTALLAGPVWGAEPSDEVAQKPNLIWVITDEHNFRTLGCYRETLAPEQALMWGPEAVVETPHVDALAKRGVLFTSMYGSSPSCTPSRSSMFTGFYPQTVGTPVNNKVLSTEFPTIATVLSDNGYHTGYCGKWHLSGKSKPGWAPEVNYGFQDNRYKFNRGHWKKLGFKDNGSPVVAAGRKNKPSSKVDGADEESFTTDWLTNRAIDYIDQHKNEPFFYVVSYPDPHTPNSVRAPYDSMYTNMKFEHPRTYKQQRDDNTPAWQRPDGKTKSLLRDMPQYFGMVKCIDDNVGRLVEKLEVEGLLDNTIIVFSSDHGDLCGEHTRVNKGVPYEASGRIPFVIADGRKLAEARVAPGKIVHQAANTTDWMATFLSLMEVANVPKTAGRDLTPLLGAETPKDWYDITFVRFRDWQMAINDRYKLYVDSSDHEPWLFDLEADPDETTNHLHLPRCAEVANTLARDLRNYMSEHNDKNDVATAKLLDILK